MNFFTIKHWVNNFLLKILPKRVYFQVIDLYLKVRYLFLLPFYAGDKFECPFCGARLRKLLPAGKDLPILKEKKVIGAGKRENGFCPRCHSLDRERLVYLFLKFKINLFKKGKEKIKLLHVAPERNLSKVLLSFSGVEYISIDLNSPLAMIKMDLTHLQFKDNSFDAVICNHVLEHIPDDRKALSEIYRVLKPGGWAILQVPISLSLKKTYEDPKIVDPEEREKNFGQKDHVRLYGQDYEERLKKTGFLVKVYHFQKELGEAKTKRYGLIEEEKIYFCQKPK